jgi:phage gpG-like protein
MSSIKITNLRDVMNAVSKNVSNIEQAAQYATGIAALEIERQAKKNADTGTHPRGQGHIPGTGPGPNRVTGTLMGSIQTTIRYGFGSYIAIVGPTVEYARAVELGSPRWKSGVKYPYLFPAGEQLSRDGTLNRVFQGALMSRLR